MTTFVSDLKNVLNYVYPEELADFQQEFGIEDETMAESMARREPSVQHHVFCSIVRLQDNLEEV